MPGYLPASLTNNSVVDANHFINFYAGADVDGFAVVVAVNTSTWAVTTSNSALEFDTDSGRYNSCAKIDTNHFINFWQGPSTDGFVQVFAFMVRPAFGNTAGAAAAVDNSMRLTQKLFGVTIVSHDDFKSNFAIILVFPHHEAPRQIVVFHIQTRLPVIFRMTFANALRAPEFEILFVERFELQQYPQALGEDGMRAYAVEIAGQVPVEILNPVLWVLDASLNACRVFVVNGPSIVLKNGYEIVFGFGTVAKQP